MDFHLRPIYTKYQRLIWNVNINACIISDHMGLQPIFGVTCFVYKKSMQFDLSNIVGDTAALMLMLSVKGPLPRVRFPIYGRVKASGSSTNAQCKNKDSNISPTLPHKVKPH